MDTSSIGIDLTPLLVLVSAIISVPCLTALLMFISLSAKLISLHFKALNSDCLIPEAIEIITIAFSFNEAAGKPSLIIAWIILG